MDVGRSTRADQPAIERLLEGASLPTAGAREAFDHGVVARAGGQVVGAAAVEVFGVAGLLRSVVVAPDRRGTGVGRSLVVEAEHVAHQAGVQDLFLMTETAADWFPRLGYEVVDREVARAAVGASIEFTLSCATNGVAMHRRLGPA